MERDDLALVFGQATEREPNFFGRFELFLVARRHTWVIPTVEIEDAFRPSASAPEVLALQVHGYCEKPRSELCAFTKIVPTSMELQEGLLDQVSRVLGLSQVVPHDTHEDRRVSIKKLPERGAIAENVGRHELFVAPHGVR